MMANKEDFLQWINEELCQRDWRPGRLARRSGLTRYTIYSLLKGRRPATARRAQGIAKAFGLPPDVVMEKAGLLPKKPEEALGLRELSHRYLIADEEKRDQILDFARFMTRGADGAGEQGANPVAPKNGRGSDPHRFDGDNDGIG